MEKRFREFLKQVHGFSETQIDKFFATDETSQTAIEDSKAKSSDSYDEGLNDGEVKSRKAFISILKKDLGISITEKELGKLDTAGKVLLPKFEEKYKQADNTDVKESESLKALQKKYDDMVVEKDNLITKAENFARQEVDDIRRDSLAKDILKDGGYTIPTDPEEYKIKLDMVKSTIEKRGYKYDVDTNGNYLRIGDDGTKVRSGNKNVTYDDDVKSLLGLVFGKTPADGKEGGISKDVEAYAGTGSKAEFDWTSIKTKGFKIPTSIDQALDIMSDPLALLEDRTLCRQFIETLEETPTG